MQTELLKVMVAESADMQLRFSHLPPDKAADLARKWTVIAASIWPMLDMAFDVHAEQGHSSTEETRESLRQFFRDRYYHACKDGSDFNG